MNSATKIAPSPLASQALNAALAGARAARVKQLAGLTLSQKSADKDDLVTEGDEASQAAILALLPGHYGPQPIAVLAEEKITGGVASPDASWRWVVDPIDGTLPYSKGEPYWCVSIALQERQKDGTWHSHIGVLYQACPEDTGMNLKGRLYWAEEGRGAFVRDLGASTELPLSHPPHIAQHAEFSGDGAYGVWGREEFKRLGIGVHFRRSICHAVCELLRGEKCAVVQDAGPLDWDIAALLPIAREAGAHVYTSPAGAEGPCLRYEVVIAWEKDLFDRFRRSFASL